MLAPPATATVAFTRSLPESSATASVTMLTVKLSVPADAPHAAFPAALLHAGQTCANALDRRVRLVDVHLDNEFEPVVVGHASARSADPRDITTCNFASLRID